jgi:indole-3-glycerol phosphate synthase
VAVIAELKKASPSKGLIRAEFDVRALAAELEAGGAAALSVLTDTEYFQGSLENLRVASEASALPCLRKDFIVDEFQILEARAYGADAILLIVAGLSDAELSALGGAARGMGLDVLCEVHDEVELRRALDAGFETIGVNNRNLKTFVVDLETSVRLSALMPEHVLRVAESGIESSADVAKLKAAGFGAFLVGEQLMRAERPGVELARLITGIEEPHSSQKRA